MNAIPPSGLLRYSFIAARCAAAGLALLATQRHPTEFYLITRWLVCVTCCWGVVLVRGRDEAPLACLYFGIGVLFNPIVPFHFARETWHNLDIAAGAVLLGSIGFSRPPKDREKESSV